jgi:type I restriction enzyme S subunit
MRPSQELNSHFAHHMLRSATYLCELKRRSKWMPPSQFDIPWDQLRTLPVLLPPLDEQRTIAAFLDHTTAKLDDLIAQKQRLIELLKEKRQALITQAVTKGLNPKAKMKDSGVPWLGQIPEHWSILPIRRLCSRIAGGVTPPSENQTYYEDGTVDWFGPGDFSEQIMLSASTRKITSFAIQDGVARMFPCGTVLVVGIGGTLGKVGIYEKPYSTNQQILNLVFDPIQILPLYAGYHLKMFEKVLLDQALYTTLPIMNQDEIGSWPIVVPPIKEQEDIVKYVKVQDETFAMKKQLKNQIEKISEYRQSLISAAVTGKIDLRYWKTA